MENGTYRLRIFDTDLPIVCLQERKTKGLAAEIVSVSEPFRQLLSVPNADMPVHG